MLAVVAGFSILPAARIDLSVNGCRRMQQGAGKLAYGMRFVQD
jgi:hypothetical protein